MTNADSKRTKRSVIRWQILQVASRLSHWVCKRTWNKIKALKSFEVSRREVRSLMNKKERMVWKSAIYLCGFDKKKPQNVSEFVSRMVSKVYFFKLSTIFYLSRFVAYYSFLGWMTWIWFVIWFYIFICWKNRHTCTIISQHEMFKIKFMLFSKKYFEKRKRRSKGFGSFCSLKSLRSRLLCFDCHYTVGLDGTGN